VPLDVFVWINIATFVSCYINHVYSCIFYYHLS
jgi:hypothetical protein